MAFLTGIGLETHLAEEEADEEALELVPKKRLALPAPQADYDQLDLLLYNEEPPSFNQLLSNVQTTRADPFDPLEELRRRIKRTRAKMDKQHKVLDGFISDVQQISGLESPVTSPRRAKAALPAPAAGKSFAALGPSPALALPGPSSRRRTTAPTASELCALSTRPSSASTSVGVKSRATAVRSSAGTLGESQSQPSLKQSSAIGRLHQKHADLVMPQRRAPPGANSNMQKSYVSSSLRRQSALETCSFSEKGSASRRYPSFSHHRLAG